MLEFSQNINYLEKVFFFYICQSKDLISICNPTFFDNEKIGITFKIVKSFTEKYEKPPSSNQVKQIIKLKGFEITDQDIDLLYSVNLDEYDPSWLEEYTNTFLLLRNLNVNMIDLLTYLKTTTITPSNIQEVVDYVRNFVSKKINSNVVIGKEDGLDFSKVEDHYQLTKTNKFSTGYTYFDKVLGGGWEKKTFNVTMARPKLGKCFLGNTMIKIRNKKTNIIQEISIEDFYKLIKK